jgi:hypothetical protein
MQPSEAQIQPDDSMRQKYSPMRQTRKDYPIFLWSTEKRTWAVQSADKHINEHCFPRDCSLKSSWPWWILPRATKHIIYS